MSKFNSKSSNTIAKEFENSKCSCVQQSIKYGFSDNEKLHAEFKIKRVKNQKNISENYVKILNNNNEDDMFEYSIDDLPYIKQSVK